jgi:hypothetical protein
MSVIYGKILHSLHRCLIARVRGRANAGWRSNNICIKEVEATRGALCYSLFRVGSYNASSENLATLSSGVKL